MRICSLYPAATEIVFALGLGDELVARSHRCDHPAEAHDAAVVTEATPHLALELQPPRSSLPSLLRHAAHGGGPLRVDVAALAALAPDVVLTQDECPACADVARAVSAAVGRRLAEVSVVRSSARSVEGVLNAISTVGAFTEAEDEAVGLIEILRERLGVIENRVLERRLDGVAAPRVVVLAWVDPPWASGGWVPEMVRRAGGWDVLGRDGEPPAPTSWDRIREVEPEHIVLAPCGLDAAGAALALARAGLPEWFGELGAVRDGGLWAMDGAGLCWRPGPRVVDGIALLSERFDPEGLAGLAPAGGWIPLSAAHVAATRPT